MDQGGGGVTGSPASDASAPRSWIVLHQPGRSPRTVELGEPARDEVTIGRDVGLPETVGHVVTSADPTVSRLHVVLARRTPGWSVQEVGATNGVVVNGGRLAPGAIQLLADGDEVRLGERTWFVFHTLVRSPAQRTVTERSQPVPDLTPGERRVLVALCSPVLDGDAFSTPATVAAIAAELHVTESAVKQQLTRLYHKFDVDEGAERRVRLANAALLGGAVGVADLRAHREGT